jgi:hypothetical protein
MRDFFQVSPERILKADAGLVSINYDGTFNDRGFHQGTSGPPVSKYGTFGIVRGSPVQCGRPSLHTVFYCLIKKV